jgi:hypothetical protein
VGVGMDKECSLKILLSRVLTRLNTGVSDVGVPMAEDFGTQLQPLGAGVAPFLILVPDFRAELSELRTALSDSNKLTKY